MVTNTYQLVDAVKKMYPVVMFFKNRYFPDGRNFYSDEVLIECKKGNKRVAPFVVPYVGGIAMPSQKYSGYKFVPPYISPKSVITVQDVRNKAFGEDPNANRSAASRQNEVQAERMDDLRQQIYRTIEKMCADVITTGECVMKHYAKPEDFGTENYQLKSLRFYEDEFENVAELDKAWSDMSMKEKIQFFYEMARTLKKRAVRATDLVLGSDVSTDLFSDADFLDYFDKKSVDLGTIKPEEIPEGVTFHGTFNINGVLMNVFSYEESYEDLDGTDKEFIPSGTIAMMTPGMGRTVYGPVDFVDASGNINSYAEQIVPHVTADEDNGIITVYESSRPVVYPLDFEGWLVADINSSGVVAASYDDELFAAYSGDDSEEIDYLTEEQINAYTTKAPLIDYAASIGLEGITDSMLLADIKEAIIKYQEELGVNE